MQLALIVVGESQRVQLRISSSADRAIGEWVYSGASVCGRLAGQNSHQLVVDKLAELHKLQTERQSARVFLHSAGAQIVRV